MYLHFTMLLRPKLFVFNEKKIVLLMFFGIPICILKKINMQKQSVKTDQNIRFICQLSHLYHMMGLVFYFINVQSIENLKNFSNPHCSI